MGTLAENFLKNGEKSVIYFYRFCCKIRITDEYTEEMPGGEFLGAEDTDIGLIRERFSHLRASDISDWYTEGPALTAYVTAAITGRDADVRRRLVDTEAAMVYTGRPRSTLYRWSDEGRLTRHANGPVGPHGRRVWDVLELPARTSVGPAPAPPRPRSTPAPAGPARGPWSRAHGPAL